MDESRFNDTLAMCFNRKMEMENRKTILFLNNARSHPDTLNLKIYKTNIPTSKYDFDLPTTRSRNY